ncbi:MAG TPA: hypothetical protein ENI23_16360 [bacterium]|nr:hypothetical protein [bacterium]
MKSLSPDTLEKIKEWLIKADPTICPFPGTLSYKCRSICKKIFPELPKINLYGYSALICPCDTYSKTFVIKKAKEVLDNAPRL